MAVDQRYGVFKIFDGTDWDVLNPEISAIQIVSGSLSMDRIAAKAITGAKVADGTIGDTQLASGISATKLTTGTLPIARIASGAVTNVKLASGIDAAKLTTGTLPIARIGAGAVVDSKLATGIDASKITVGTLPTSVLPTLAITKTTEVASEVLMLAITPAPQEGDVAVRSDENKTYICNGGDPTALAGWTLLRTPTDQVISVAGEAGVITKASMLSALSLSDARGHIDDDTKHRLIDDGSYANDVLWSGFYIDQVLGSYSASDHDHDGDYEAKNTNIQTHITNAAALHRTIDDGATGATDLWSASMIISQLATKAANGHDHDADYAAIDDPGLSNAKKVQVMDTATYNLYVSGGNPTTNEIVFVY